MKKIIPLLLAAALYVGGDLSFKHSVEVTVEDLLEGVAQEWLAEEWLTEALGLTGAQGLAIDVTKVYLDGNYLFDSWHVGSAFISLGGEHCGELAIQVRGNGLWEETLVDIPAESVQDFRVGLIQHLAFSGELRGAGD